MFARRITLLCFILVISTGGCSNGEAAPQDATSCTTGRCLLERIPRSVKPSLSMEACSALDGKSSSIGESGDLGLLCRLRVARAHAAFRAEKPCTDDGSLMPDWSMTLEESLRLRLFNELVGAPYLEEHGITFVRDTGGSNNSTIHDSYVFNTFFHDKQRDPRTYVSSATYFCRTSDPEHYVPYFYILRINDGPNANQGSANELTTVVMASVDSMPVKGEHIVYQLGGLEDGNMTAYEVADVNGDGHLDFVMLDEQRVEETYPLRACLFTAGAQTCKLLQVDTGLTTDVFMVRSKLRVDGGRITTSLEDFGSPVAVQSFEVRGEELVAVEP